MKKNVMMRLASFLLVAVLISTSAISGTYAKYTTQDSGSDTARVAKWGVELQVVGNLYGDTYVNNIVKDANDEGNNIRVQSVDKSTDVVAPGTQNTEGFTFSLKGQPEVDGIVTTTMKIQNVFLKAGSYGVMIPVDTGVITEANYDEFKDLYYKSGENFVAATASDWSATRTFYTLEDEVVVADNYYPVVYTLTGKTNATGTDSADSLKAAADAIATQLGLTAGNAADDTSITYTGTTSFEANTDLATEFKVDGLSLTWAWAFGAEDKVGDNADENDMADTILGMLEDDSTTPEGTVVKLIGGNGTIFSPVAAHNDYCLDTQFSIDITVTQID